MTDLPAPQTRAAAREAARALHGRIKATHRQSRREVEFATVVEVVPRISVELHESSGSANGGSERMILREEQDLQLSDFLRWWEINFGIAEGDVVLAIEGPNAVWIAFDIVTTRDVDAGMRPMRPAATFGDPMRVAETTSDVTYSGTDPQGGSVTVSPDSHHLVRKLEVYDRAGNRLGYVAIWDSLP